VLSPAEQDRTRQELERELTRSGWTAERLAAALEVPVDRVHAALDVCAARPADVWMVRDLLAVIVRGDGGSPGPFTCLSDAARASAESWFTLRPESAITDAVRRALGAGVQDA